MVTDLETKPSQLQLLYLMRYQFLFQPTRILLDLHILFPCTKLRAVGSSLKLSRDGPNLLAQV